MNKFFNQIILPILVVILITSILKLDKISFVFLLFGISGLIGMFRAKFYMKELSFNNLVIIKTNNLKSWYLVGKHLFINPEFYKTMDNDEYNVILLRYRQQMETGWFLFWFIYFLEYLIWIFAHLFKWKVSKEAISFNQEINEFKDGTKELNVKYRWLNYIFRDTDTNSFIFA